MTDQNKDKLITFSELPLISLRGIVLFPDISIPIFVGRENTKEAIEFSINNTNRLIFVCTQIEEDIITPTLDEVYPLGVIAEVLKVNKSKFKGEDTWEVVLRGINKSTIKSYSINNKTTKVKLETVDMSEMNEKGKRMLEASKKQIVALAQQGFISPVVAKPEYLDTFKTPYQMVNILSALNIGLSVEERQKVLSAEDNDAIEIIVSHIQRTLKQGLKNTPSISRGSSDEEGEEDTHYKIIDKKMPPEVEKEALFQEKRLRSMNPDSSEYTVTKTYIDWLIDIPWKEESNDNVEIKEAREILDKSHYGMKEVKERIIEYLAVKKLKNEIPGVILCLDGPPGVGKTSLARSIADSLDRDFVRVSLGGVRDESEIRGHRRTYVGSMPGKIIQALKTAGTINPVILLDEIDKTGNDQRGDPSSALLEVLDPEQNKEFKDHYVNLPVDLSKVMFIATSNNMSNIPKPLMDRMEVISLTGYTREEKLKIAKTHIIPSVLDDNGLKDVDVKVSDEAVKSIIANYTRESGVRNMRRGIDTAVRKVACRVAESGEMTKKYKVTKSCLLPYLGPAKFKDTDMPEENQIGVVTGLAWTSVGGEVLYVETTKIADGKGKIIITGKLGDIMKESVQTALSVTHNIMTKKGSSLKDRDKWDYHIHFPDGATPKDGPSAGVTVVTALYSLFTKKPVRREVAMTGEVSLTGKVLPIGGLKEKLLAAYRYGSKVVIIPKDNEKDLHDLPEEIKSLDIKPVSNVSEVLEIAIAETEL